jgi:phosphomannomutase
VPFAYEEAIGFMIGCEIRDKDGIAATVPILTFSSKTNALSFSQVFFAELAANLRRKGSSVAQFLSQLYSK